ncbi:hypothetical protein E1264_08400, partial [Actinomadura sp. KC216]|uniref:hypothetical protein n=1 Tax=Actinomadura sp. KC216 TaxID=2530370 RepID=UPI0010DA1E80
MSAEWTSVPAEWERRDQAPDPSVWATVRTPALPSISECNPAAVRWRDLVIDPDLAGLVPGRARPSSIVITDGGDEWRLPLDDVLPTRLAWHPQRPLLAGLAIRERRAYVWTADHRARTVTVHLHLRAAVSFTAYGHPPVAWCGDDRLVLPVPGPDADARPDGDAEAAPPEARPVAFEATGPNVVAFEPPPEELVRLAGARLAVADLGSGTGESTPLTPPMLLRSLLPAPTGNKVIATHGYWDAGDEALHWADVLIDLDAPGTPRPVPSGGEYRALLEPPPSDPEPTAGAVTATRPAVPIPTGLGTATLALPPAVPG